MYTVTSLTLVRRTVAGSISATVKKQEVSKDRASKDSATPLSSRGIHSGAGSKCDRIQHEKSAATHQDGAPDPLDDSHMKCVVAVPVQ